MIDVSDTSPLNYLVLIEAVEVLPALFGRVVVPPAVIEELQAQGAARMPSTPGSRPLQAGSKFAVPNSSTPVSPSVGASVRQFTLLASFRPCVSLTTGRRDARPNAWESQSRDFSEFLRKPGIGASSMWGSSSSVSRRRVFEPARPSLQRFSGRVTDPWPAPLRKRLRPFFPA